MNKVKDKIDKINWYIELLEKNKMDYIYTFNGFKHLFNIYDCESIEKIRELDSKIDNLKSKIEKLKDETYNKLMK
jgi:hypothetical protein